MKSFFILRDQVLVRDLVQDHVLDQVLALMAAIVDSVDIMHSYFDRTFCMKETIVKAK